ncbi:MAG: uracil-DNA glycosylase family protein [Cyclobacteriaceae bacterium]
MNPVEDLLTEIRSCRICEQSLPLGPNPIVQFSENSRILVVGQAPGTRVHKTGIPWNDPSGNNLRKWMDIDSEVFYDTSKIAIVPMGFCYPGKGKSGDLPPRTECAEAWHQKVLDHLPNLELTLLIGQYAQNYYLKGRLGTLTETVQNWKAYQPRFFPLPHPSPRNNIWMRKNPWFGEEVLPQLQKSVRSVLEPGN